MANYDYDLVIVGAGPGGYVAGIRASQLGLKVAVIEKEAPGGVCLNWGCIPSKALIHQAEIAHSVDDLTKMGASVDMSGFDYSKVHKKSRDAAGKLSKGVQSLLKKNKVDYIEGTATFKGPHEVDVDGKRTVSGTNVMIATGSRSREIPGFEFDGKKILSSRDILGLTELPKKLVILGAGAIGMEFAYVMNAFGVEVTVVEMLDQILPLEDSDAVDVVAKAFKRYGITTMTGTKAKSVDKKGKGVKCHRREGGRRRRDALRADMMLVAVGRAPNTEGTSGLESVGVTIGARFRGRRRLLSDQCPGDLRDRRRHQFAVACPRCQQRGRDRGRTHGRSLIRNRSIDPDLIPSAVYCEPEIGSFGSVREKAAKEKRGVASTSHGDLPVSWRGEIGGGGKERGHW